MTDCATDKKIIEYITGQNGDLVRQRCSKSALAGQGYFDYIVGRYPDIGWSDERRALKESLYRLRNGIETPPVCPVCGEPVRFDAGNKMYPKWCSAKCRNNDPSVKEKNSAGVSAALKHAYSERGGEIKARRAATLSERYGAVTSSPFSAESVRDKAERTMIERHGVTNAFQMPEHRAAAADSIRKNSVGMWKERDLDIEYTDGGTVIIRNGCPVHGDIELDIRTFNNRTKPERINMSAVCPLCNPIDSCSGPETEIKNDLDLFGIEYVMNDRSVIKPYELDFYIPDKKLAVEFNGVYFHGDRSGKPADYHRMKSDMCAAKGIELIHIWENEWAAKKSLVLSTLRYKLGIHVAAVYARDCEVRKITAAESKRFFERNHLQGNVGASYRYGLFDGAGVLIAAMTFGPTRRMLGADGRDCELYRFCVMSGVSVPGGASKLFKAALPDLRSAGFKKIITYARRDWSSGGLYKKLGFTFIQYTSPGYFWADGRGTTLSRYSCRKDLLVKSGADPDMTETEIMTARGFYKCHDSGNMKFEYIL